MLQELIGSSDTGLPEQEELNLLERLASMGYISDYGDMRKLYDAGYAHYPIVPGVYTQPQLSPKGWVRYIWLKISSLLEVTDNVQNVDQS